MNRREKLFEVQKYNFAAYDMLLYLDTHPTDTKAFAMFKDLVGKLRAAREEYEGEYGALEPYDAADTGAFAWLDSPWPWEKEENE